MQSESESSAAAPREHSTREKRTDLLCYRIGTYAFLTQAGSRFVLVARTPREGGRPGRSEEGYEEAWERVNTRSARHIRETDSD